ncbi:sugar phosphate isomerase/epimerase family protein [Streptacidiphilus anmyonensis]|uniref:sugar phosphate isomerase/epimerase family protein n=1 Tax=Streptacidiphilus anmyonensis TaxID=405782 RepID=UPI0007C6B158|nr:sugar phosphate isomerase/epimerase family protein [Streptacidiphilus anmyonensis]
MPTETEPVDAKPVDAKPVDAEPVDAKPPGPPVLAGIGDEAALGIEEQLAAVTALGWRSIELRTVDGTPLAELSEAAFDRVVGALAHTGVSVVAVDARIGGWARSAAGDFTDDLDELAVLERRCARLGTRFVRVMSFPAGGLDADAWEREALRRMRVLAARADAAGLTLLHENCSGWAGADADRTVRLLEAAGPGLGLLFDTGNGPAHGYDGHDLLRRLLRHVDRILHVHIKDAVLGPDGRPRYCEPGAGTLRVAESLRLLLAHGYGGALSIEPHIAVRPHENHRDSADQCHAAFLRCGMALRRLLDSVAAPPPAPPGTPAPDATTPALPEPAR